MKERIWLSPPHMGHNEILYIKEAFEKNWIAPAGPNIKLFEDSISNFTQVEHAVAVNSGTSALHLALILLNIKPGDEVICSSFTFIASANPILYLKARPVFVDSDQQSWNMDPDLLEEAIEDRIKKGVKPKAIIVVHSYGNAARITEILSIAKKHQIPVVEDAAQAYGSTYQKKMLGSFGKIGVYSFNGNKIITTSSGGALVTNNKDLAAKATYLSNQARNETEHFTHSDIGYNYRMSNILAGIGLGQMKIVYERIKQRRQVFEYYREALQDIPAISFIPETDDSVSNRWLTCIALTPNAPTTPTEIKESLEKQNVESRYLWKPLHLQPIYQSAPFYGSGFSEKLFKTGLALPSGSSLKMNELDRVIDVIRDKFSH